jgi:hypothetical protein
MTNRYFRFRPIKALEYYFPHPNKGFWRHPVTWALMFMVLLSFANLFMVLTGGYKSDKKSSRAEVLNAR